MVIPDGLRTCIMNVSTSSLHEMVKSQQQHKSLRAVQLNQPQDFAEGRQARTLGAGTMTKLSLSRQASHFSERLQHAPPCPLNSVRRQYESEQVVLAVWSITFPLLACGQRSRKYIHQRLSSS
jgi:hypothetical protein